MGLWNTEVISVLRYTISKISEMQANVNKSRKDKIKLGIGMR